MSRSIIYLDAGPVVSLNSRDRYSDQVALILDDPSTSKVTSYVSCLEALVVLRRAEFRQYRGTTDIIQMDKIWNSILLRLDEAGVAVRIAPSDHSFSLDGIEMIIDILSRSPLRMSEKNRSRWITGVGIIDCVHLMAAKSLSATHFLTTDRCLSEMDEELEMILVPEEHSIGGQIGERPVFMMLCQMNHASEETRD
jgi:hypothetical protein